MSEAAVRFTTGWRVRGSPAGGSAWWHSTYSFHDPIGSKQHVLRDRESQRSGASLVHYKFDLRRLFDRHIGGLRTPQDAIDIEGATAGDVIERWCVGKEPPGERTFRIAVHRWQTLRQR